MITNNCICGRHVNLHEASNLLHSRNHTKHTPQAVSLVHGNPSVPHFIQTNPRQGTQYNCGHSPKTQTPNKRHNPVQTTQSQEKNLTAQSIYGINTRRCSAGEWSQYTPPPTGCFITGTCSHHIPVCFLRTTWWCWCRCRLCVRRGHEMSR